MKTLTLVLFFALALLAGNSHAQIEPCRGSWNTQNAAIAATAATVTQAAAGAGKRLVIDCAIGNLATAAAAQSTIINLELKFGATTKFTTAVSQPATDSRQYGACGLNLVVPDNTAATLAFAANNDAAGSFSRVFLSGCTIQP